MLSHEHEGLPSRQGWRIGLALAVLGLLVAGCAGRPQTLELSTSPDVPAAQGQLQFAEAENGNTKLDLVVKHLASPDKVVLGGSTYVVWVQPTAGGSELPRNVGALTVNSDLEGRLSTLTPLKDFDLFITVESSPTVSVPTGARVLSGQVHR